MWQNVASEAVRSGSLGEVCCFWQMYLPISARHFRLRCERIRGAIVRPSHVFPWAAANFGRRPTAVEKSRVTQLI